jgi:hypothetical protein
MRHRSGKRLAGQCTMFEQVFSCRITECLSAPRIIPQPLPVKAMSACLNAATVKDIEFSRQ